MFLLCFVYLSKSGFSSRLSARSVGRLLSFVPLTLRCCTRTKRQGHRAPCTETAHAHITNTITSHSRLSRVLWLTNQTRRRHHLPREHLHVAADRRALARSFHIL